ncbi:unnamed protein product [Ectocarpus sp. 12 AP-2014]
MYEYVGLRLKSQFISLALLAIYHFHGQLSTVACASYARGERLFNGRCLFQTANTITFLYFFCLENGHTTRVEAVQHPMLATMRHLATRAEAGCYVPLGPSPGTFSSLHALHIHYLMNYLHSIQDSRRPPSTYLHPTRLPKKTCTEKCEPAGRPSITLDSNRVRPRQVHFVASDTSGNQVH